MNNVIVDLINRQKHLVAVVFLSSMLVHQNIYAQEKHLVQVKTFNEQLQPYKNIDLSINGKDYIHVDNKATAFIELYDNELPLKSIKIKNETLEAASWNYSKGVVEVIIRKKNYHIVPIVITNVNNERLANITITYNGKKTITVTSNSEGYFELPLALDEKITSAEQFSVENYRPSSIQVSGSETILIAVPLKQEPKEVVSTTNEIQSSKEFFSDFDLSKLDSIQSLTVFYAIFKNYQIRDMSPAAKKKIDAKFNQLVRQLEDSLRRNEVVFIGKISDSSFVDDDIQNLVEQARVESQTLEAQRNDFDQKMALIQEKIAAGIENLDAVTRSRLLNDLTMLEAILMQNENKFYKNQSDYRQIINSLKENFFDIEDLEVKLSASEARRLEEQRVFRQRLFIIVSISIVFAVLIILLINFSQKLRKQKKELTLANIEINRINENLEGLVSERTKMLEAANRELDIFLYRASHDLRSPVCSIIGLCNLAGHFSTGEAKDLLDKVVYTTSAMDRLLKKLTIISEINQPTNFSAINLRNCVEHVIYTLGKLVSENKVKLQINCADDLVVHSYPNLIEAIFTNLIENAIFFGSLKNSNELQVEFSAVVKEDQLQMTFFDNGIGIDKKITHKVFDMFFKGNVYSKGNGLGLYIVQKSVQALGGDIWLESDPGKFTRFIVHLPLMPERVQQDLLAEANELHSVRLV